MIFEIAITCSMCGTFLGWSKHNTEIEYICNNCRSYIIRRRNGLVSAKSIKTDLQNKRKIGINVDRIEKEIFNK